ncbi:acyltransferase family protein [Metabacillus sp. Hm71]|uniref:acyltransferase family protein n=1 Tax=Metabacillus sp. Hm71 TaxID=3450743 RepID=UPI003F42E6FD
MLNSLTSFRFIAALSVFIFHVGYLENLQLGAAGVSFFFVLSGFIMAYTYHSKFINLEKDIIKKYYWARFAKIYPVHVLTFLISAPLTLMWFHPESLYWLKLAIMSGINLLLVQSYVPNQGTYFNFNGVSWTLSVEVLFYLTCPFLIWTFTKLNVKKHIISSLVIGLLIWTVFFNFNLKLDESDTFLIWMLHIFPVARLFEFAMGVILGLIFVSKYEEKRKNKALYNTLETISILTLVGVMLYSTNLDVGAVRGGLFIPVWCLVIYIFAFQAGVISRILSNKALVYLGEISFSFYMIHQLVIRYYEFFNMSESLKGLICFIVSLVLSSIMYRYYEEPLRKKIRYGLKKKKEINYEASA